jgi:hypothetical protein
VDDALSVADSPSLDITGSVTIDAWVRFDAVTDFQHWVAGKGGTYQLVITGDSRAPAGRPAFFIHNPLTGFVGAIGSSALAFGTFVHLAGTYDVTTGVLRVYVNGVENGSATVAPGTSVTANDAPFGIGGFPGGGGFGPQQFLKGLIDEVELFNRALTSQEIQATFSAGSAGKCKVTIVAIDIKPGSDPNCFNIDGHGVIPVAILGSADFDVTDVDPQTVLFDGLEVRVRGNKGPLCSFEDSNGDSFLDLVCHFEDDPGSWTGGTTTATLTGQLFDGTTFEGTDSICIVP